MARESRQVRHRRHTPPPTPFPRLVAYRVPQPCNLDGISMKIQEENSACYFRVQSEREQTTRDMAERQSPDGNKRPQGTPTFPTRVRPNSASS